MSQYVHTSAVHHTYWRLLFLFCCIAFHNEKLLPVINHYVVFLRFISIKSFSHFAWQWLVNKPVLIVGFFFIYTVYNYINVRILLSNVSTVFFFCASRAACTWLHKQRPAGTSFLYL